MKTCLLKRLRAKGRSKIKIVSTTTYKGVIIGMTIKYTSSAYKNLFRRGDTEKDVKNKAASIYIEKNLKSIRTYYKKYSIKNKKR